MITRQEILKGRSLPLELEANAADLLKALNEFRQAYGKPMTVTSGYRDPEHNLAIGGRPFSAHLLCQAADFRDFDNQLARFCLSHLDLLERCGLWMEDPLYTPHWVHLQIRPAHNRVFLP